MKRLTPKVVSVILCRNSKKNNQQTITILEPMCNRKFWDEATICRSKPLGKLPGKLYVVALSNHGHRQSQGGHTGPPLLNL